MPPRRVVGLRRKPDGQTGPWELPATFFLTNKEGKSSHGGEQLRANFDA